MTQVHELGQAGLTGWRKSVADHVAPAAASKAPASEEQVRAIIGAAFFALSLFYVVSTLVRLIRTARD
jgi:hypothetical protein